MAVEAARGCGYRQVGGLYLVAPGIGLGCELLPFSLAPCPLCGLGFKQTRSFQWMPEPLLREFAGVCRGTYKTCTDCYVCTPNRELEMHGEMVTISRLTPDDMYGLMWVGKEHYPSALHFTAEAIEQGISRRIAAIPRGFTLGETVVLLAHPKALTEDEDDECPGVFAAFKPAAVELIVTPEMRQEDWVQRYEERGVQLVEVPADDPDHNRKPGRPPKNPQQSVAGVTSLFDDEDSEEQVG